MKRIVTIVLCVFMAICMFGCGSSEKKYTNLKNEVIASMKDFDKKTPDPYFSGLTSKSRIPDYEKYIANAQPVKKSVLPKLEEMKKLAKDELKLSNDFEKFEKDTMKKLNRIETYKEKIEYLKNSRK